MRSTRGVRGYYWGVVIPAIARGGSEPHFRDTHRWLKHEFLPAGDSHATTADLIAALRQPLADCDAKLMGPYAALDAIHELLRDYEAEALSDETNYYSTSFAALPEDEYRDYVDRVVTWARTEGIDVPPPTTEEEPW